MDVAAIEPYTSEVVAIPPVTTVVVPFDGFLPSHSTCPLFFPIVDHMHDNPYLRAQQTGRMYSISSLAS